MSTTIDQKVVEMRFDNKQFESNVQTSMSSIDKLKQSLNFTGASKSLENVNSAVKNVNMSGLSSAIETVQVKFSALEVMAVTALANITNSAINTGKRMISALTIDPVKTGFSEYETQINAVQTILANTSSKGTTLDQVNAALDTLNTYADKTIYNFTEMTRNIGTFTAAGIDLDTSVTAIQGIANLAAVSGSNAQQASTAMYQLSQALASGTVKLMDWNSVVNAGMGGQVFQDALKETARVHGIAIDEMITSEGSFRETLQKGWLTSEILTETLSKFTMATEGLTEAEIEKNREMLRGQGYTEKQIEEIFKLGNTATNAATKVKTFTQLWDTLKEAAQSGWTQSWEIIIGDFEEAKMLFTDVSNVIGEMIGSSANARNEVLQGWKDLGGRTAIIDAIRNSFEGIMSIIKPISEAFREIFPPITAQQLVNFSNGLRDLTAKFKLSSTASENLKTTFKGLFSILDIIKQAFKAVLNAIAPLFGGISGLHKGILGVMASFGSWIISVNEAIKTNDIFNKALQSVSKAIVNLKVYLDLGIKNFKAFVETLKTNFVIPGLEAAKEVINSIVERLEILKGVSVQAFETVKTSATDGIDSANEKLSAFFNLINNIKEGLFNFGAKVKEAFGSIWSEIGDAFSEVTVTDAIGTGMIAGIVVVIRRFIKNLDKVVANFDDVMNGVVEVLESARGVLEAYQTSLKADTLFKIAASVAILAAALIALTFVNPDKLKDGLIGVSILLAEVVATMEILNKFKVTGIAGAATSMILVSVAISVLAGTLDDLKEFQSWDQTWPALLAMASLMAGLVVSAKALNSVGGKNLISSSIGLAIFAAAVDKLASAMSTFGSLKPEELKRGLVTLGVLLTEIAVFIKASKLDQLKSGKKTIIEIALSMLVLYAAVKLFGEMEVGALQQGLLSVTGVLTALALSVRIMGSIDMKGTATALVGMASALALMCVPIKLLGEMDFNQLQQGLIAVGLALAGMTIVMTALGTIQKIGGSFAGIAVGLIGMSVALALLCIPIKALSTLSWEALAVGLVGLLVPMIAFAGMAALLAPLGPVLLMVAGALAVFGVATLAIGAGLVQLGLGFAALAALGSAGALAVVAALTIIIGGVAALIPQIMAVIAQGMIAFAKVIISGAPTLCEAVSILLLSLIKIVRDVTPAVVETVVYILVSLLQTLAKYTPTIVQAVFDVLIACLKGIADNIGMVVQTAIDIVIGFIDGISQKIPDVIQTGFDLLLSFINGITNAINTNTPLLVKAMKDLFWALVNAAILVLTGGIVSFKDVGNRIMNSGLIQGIKDKISNLKQTMTSLINAAKQCIISKFKEWRDAGRDILQNVIDGISSMVLSIKRAVTNVINDAKRAITDKLDDFFDIGANIIEGLIDGVKSAAKKLIRAVKNVLSDALDSAKDFLGINSPSKEFAKIGRYSDEGLVVGLKSYSGKVADAAAGVGKTALNSMKNTIAGIAATVNSDIDSQPTIRPVLDLSNVETGTRRLSSMFSRSQALKVSGQMNQTPSEEIQNGANASNNDTAKFQFIQNNYSPKALSRVEIYRQTKNQFSAMERMVRA